MTARPTLVYLTESEVRSSLTMPEAISLAERGIEADAVGDVAGDKFYMAVGDNGFIKPFSGYMKGDDLAYVKTFSFFEGNAAQGLPVTDSVVLLFDAETGLPVAIMEANWLTGLKTGASTGATVRRLARPDSKVATIFGAGGLGRHHGEAIDHVLSLDELRIVDSVPEAAHHYAAEMADQIQAPIRVFETAEDAVTDADVVITVTTGSAVNVESEWVKPGAFIARLGSYQEVSLDLFQKVDRLVVDRWEYVSYRIPEMVSLISAGKMRRADVVEWPDIVSGAAPGRQADDETILYVALGIWGEYAAILPEAYRRARAAGLGTVIAGG
ncbi:MAG: ornithine cyclodeaminase family protein [Acidimicrobiia bacterium]|nr:ornithine cyclodeaminase family protein [Acidimicrobiia bacterium]